ncbi:unnamed protein product [Ostreobium quekettii]|uniref:Uncharacterized protein n=1 Tax=Ostreobium quekettii TaxID=121088 RepID=A0A8S1IL03_9CHLO|nr:unnamed protein product [Ostreobium quekettii]|eukprot:evm.model.scf_807EXC.4 EVM.evm.TU.scf_807EXC.4   scf_807EXC:24824-27589(+)
MERKHSVENPRELLNRAFGQGKEEGGGIAQAEGVLAGAGQPVDGPGGAAALDVPGLSLPAVSVSLEGGQGGESAEKWSRGAGPTSGMFLDVNTTPKVDSSPLGLYDGDRERLKAGSKLTGPLPWDDDADMDDEAGSPQAQHSQISSLAAACEQEDGQHVDAVAARTLAPLSIGDHPSSMEAAPLGSSHGVGMETGKSAGSRADLDKDASEAPSSRKRAEETTASGPAQEPDVLGLRVHDNQRDDSAREMSGLPLRKEQFEKSAIEVDATPQQPQGVLGITLEDDQFAAEHHAAISLPGGAEATIREEDHSVHQSAQQRGLEDTNGKLHPGPLPKNGYTMNLDGIDMGAMLLDIQELLGYVDSSDSKIAERKSLSQAQLARIIQALKLGEPVSMKVASAPVGQQTHREQTEGDQVALAPDRSVAVEELTEKLQQCEEKLNDAALAIGMQTRKVVALKQHCEAHGVAADAVVEEIEAMYYSKKDSSLVEDTEVASPWDQGGAADASFPAVTVKSHQASYSPSHCLPESDPHDFLGVAPSHDSHRQIDGMI